MMRKTFAILYGFAEGPYRGRTLVQHLEKQGLREVRDHISADVLIGHSGECFMVPKSNQAQVILLVGLPHWPGRPILVSLLKKWWREEKNVDWIKKTAYHLFYLLSDIPRLLQMALARQRHTLPEGSRKRIVLIRPSKDVFLDPNSAPKLAEKHGWEYVELPGQHDDLWRNPEPYVELLMNVLDG